MFLSGPRHSRTCCSKLRWSAVLGVRVGFMVEQMVEAAAGGAPMPTLSVQQALAQMQACVCQGKMQEAREIGARAAVPLSLTAEELHLGAKISEGAESVVYEGTYRGQPVAVKKLRLSTSSDLDRFRSELKLLASLEHPHVITLVGAKALPPDYMMVLQLQLNNLQQMLYEHAWRPSWEVILRIGSQAAAAVAAVHELGVVHRDLKPANILMGTDGAPRISDFGISVPLSAVGESYEETSRTAFCKGRIGRPSGGFHKQRMAGTLEYMAPEVLLKEATSLASDVYAFAVTLNELATAVVPFSDCTKDNPEVHTVLEMGYGRQELAAAVAAEGLRPLLPRVRPPGYEALLSACWQRHPADRPSMQEVGAALRDIAAAVPAWLQENAATVANGVQSMDCDVTVCRGEGEGEGAVKGVLLGQPLPRVVAQVLGPEEEEADGVQGAAAQAQAGRWRWRREDGDEYLPVLSAGAFEAIGPRDSMEDRHLLLPHWAGGAAGIGGPGEEPPPASGAEHRHPVPTSPQLAGGAPAAVEPGLPPSAAGAARKLSLLGIFDGHRGHEAAAYCRARLPGVLAESCQAAASPEAALRRAFLDLDQGYRAVWEADCASRLQHGKAGGQYPGCTALAVLLVDQDLYVANAGDCRAVVRRGARAVALSRDHTAALEDERLRIQAQGGSVSWQHNGWRLGTCGLQVSRSIGDFDQKGRGLTADPEVMHLRLGPEDSLLILGSDGLWDCVSSEEAVGLVQDTVKDPMLCAKRLVLEALARGSQDNVTAVVAFLRPVNTLERVFAEGRQAFEATATVYGSRRGKAQDLAHGAAADELSETY